MKLSNLIDEYKTNLDSTSIYALRSLKDNHRIPMEKIAQLLHEWAADYENKKSDFFEYYAQKGLFIKSFKSSASLIQKGLLTHRKQAVLRHNYNRSLEPRGEVKEKALDYDPVLGRQLGRCKIISLIAEGSSCKVYLADHMSLGIKVAVKIFKKLKTAINLEDFRREAQTAARFNHPSFVRVLDFDDGALPHLVLEFVDGYTVSELIKSSKTINLDDSLKYLKKCAEAFSYLHDMKLVHRDIKPANLLITKGGEIKISDFGISRFLNKENLSGSDSTPCGTPLYIAPEQAVYPELIDTRSDIYSLGATFFHILTGRTPFQTDNVRSMILKHINVPVESPSLINEKIPESVSAIIMKMMAKNLDERFSTMSEIKEEILKIENSKQPEVKPKKRASTIFRFK